MDRAKATQRLRAICEYMTKLLKEELDRARGAGTMASNPLGAGLHQGDAGICLVIHPLIPQAARLADGLGRKRPPIVEATLDFVGPEPRRFHTDPELESEADCVPDIEEGCREAHGYLLFDPDDGAPSFVCVEKVHEGTEPGRYPVQSCPDGQAVNQIIAGLTGWAIALDVGVEGPEGVADGAGTRAHETPAVYSIEAAWGRCDTDEEFDQAKAAEQGTPAYDLTVRISAPGKAPTLHSMRGGKKARLFMSALYKQYRISQEEKRLRGDGKGRLHIWEIVERLDKSEAQEKAREAASRVAGRLAHDLLQREEGPLKLQSRPGGVGKGHKVEGFELIWDGELPEGAKIKITIPRDFVLKKLWPDNSDTSITNSDT